MPSSRLPVTLRAWPLAVAGLALAAVLPAAPQSAVARGVLALGAWKVPAWTLEAGEATPMPEDGALEATAEEEELLDAVGSASTPVAPATACSDNHVVKTLERPTWVRHRVVPRESIDQIAYRYQVTPAQVRSWNDLPADLETVRSGTRLEIKTRVVPPPRRKIEYTVAEGDTWWRVGVAHGVDASDLRAYNWPYRNKMRPGEQLTIFVDPIVHDWIRGGPPLVFEDEGKVIRRGGISIGPPDDGRLVGGVRIPAGEGYRLRFPESAYGTTHAVSQLVSALQRFRETTTWEGEIAVGAMSRSRGGLLGTHVSHQSGRDVDIRLPRRRGIPSWYSLKLSRVDWNATWDLVRALASTDTQVIFLEYKAQRRLYKAAVAAGASEEELDTLLQFPRGGSRGLVRHADGHDKHLHARFDCGPCEPECVRQSAGDQP